MSSLCIVFNFLIAILVAIFFLVCHLYLDFISGILVIQKLKKYYMIKITSEYMLVHVNVVIIKHLKVDTV